VRAAQAGRNRPQGRNRQQFEKILHGNIRAALRDLGVPVDLRQREG